MSRERAVASLSSPVIARLDVQSKQCAVDDTDVGYLESRTILIVVLACQDDAVVSAPFA
ncbi:hypothetical protein [Bradyrhizobium sp. USDA 4451]